MTKTTLSRPQPPAAPSPIDQSAYPTWSALSWLFLIRLLLVGLLALMFSPVADSPLMEGGRSPYTWSALGVYAVLVLASGLAMYARWPDRQHQVQLAVFTDIMFFTILLHLSGGVSSGLGLLLSISVAAGALLMEGRQSLVFASLATIAVIAEQVYDLVFLHAPAADMTRGGLLGITYFVVALLARVLYRRIWAAEQLAEQRKTDLEGLYKINEFIIQNMETGVVVIDETRRLRLMNAAASQLLGKTNGDGGARLDETCPELAEWIDAAGAPNASRLTRTIRLRDRDIQPTLAILGDEVAQAAVIFLQDTQELARRAQDIKLVALGKLSGSIAHNIRNPLAAISHAGQLLAESTSLHRDDRHLADIVTRNVRRIEETVQSILTLPRREPSQLQDIELAGWLEEFRSDWAEAQRFPLQHCQLDIDQVPICVRVDPRHLRQILVNLCDNAAHHARGAGPYANIRLHAGRQQDGAKAILEVLDDGPGVDAETARGIFDPFVTTSSAGTGLGLYVARELAESNAIRLDYSPRPTGGSCFRLTFAA